MKTVSFTLLALFTACATPNIHRETVGLSYQSDNRLSHYVNDFLTDCRKYLSDSACNPSIELHVKVKQLPDDILGQCLIYQSKLRVIQLDDTVLNQYNEREVVYHELFHCVMNKPHVDGELDIMNSFEVEENTQQIYADWSYYVGKVFTRE